MLKRFIALGFLLFAGVLGLNWSAPVSSQTPQVIRQPILQPTPSRIAPEVLEALSSRFAPINNHFPDAHDSPPADWHGPVFKLSQEYPTILIRRSYPWQDIDPNLEPLRYLNAVLAYGYEGNIEVDFVIQNNPVRKWYHTPWLHAGNNGREFIHGLTKERGSRPGDLAPTQTAFRENWAVGFYNEYGGRVIGKVWEDPNAPTPGPALFLEGTVAMKLLFTEATEEEVPFLRGSYTWEADINRNSHDTVEMRLLQIDIAVKDKRSKPTGWVFGTYIYNADAPGATPFERMVPIGLMVGNDPKALTDNGPLRQTYINPAAVTPRLGFGGRLNGPVDNPKSSCLSCHSTAQVPYPYDLDLPRIDSVPPDDATPEQLAPYFRNIRSGTPFTSGYTSLDYSLQLQVGIANFLRANPTPPSLPFAPRAKARRTGAKKVTNILPIQRDGTLSKPVKAKSGKKKGGK